MLRDHVYLIKMNSIIKNHYQRETHGAPSGDSATHK
jgi:hypothetical protein